MKRAMVGLLAAAAVAASAGSALAQGTLPISAEVRLDAGLPIGDFHDAARSGVGWGVSGMLDLSPTLALYAGYSSFDFELKDSTIELRDDGLDVGARLILGTGGGVVTTFAQFGALFHNGDTGFEGGLGAEYPVSRAVKLTPLARYRKLGDAEYIGLGVGLSFRP